MSDIDDTSKSVAEPFITIGMPVYNGEKYISAALDGLLAQTYSNFILHISDNASTDATLEIIAKYAASDSRIRITQQSKNLGPLDNFRYLFDQCRTPYFAWAAADDVLSADWLEKLVPLVISRPCIAFGAIVTISENGEEVVHPANRRKFDYSSSIFWRRLRFYLTPGVFGKANPIYGLFPVSQLGSATWRAFSENGNAGDIAALYSFLSNIPIVSDPSAILYKRRHRDNAALQTVDGERRKPWFRTTRVPIYWKQSAPLERAAIAIFYPLAVFGIVTARVAFIINRLIHGKTRPKN